VPWWGILAAGLAGTVLAVRAGGTDPGLSLDVVGDQVFFRWCLEGACGTVGIASSLNRIAHGATWLHFRALWQTAGLGEGALHLLLHGSFGLAVALVAATAWRRRGPLAGWLAAAIFAALCLLSDLKIAMVYNHRPFPFLGALVAALALLAVERQRLAWVAAAASVAAIATNLHMATATWGPAMLVIGALAWRRRPWVGAATGGLAFLLVGAGSAPGAWWNNLQVLLASAGIEGTTPTPRMLGSSLPTWACRVALGIALTRTVWPRMRPRPSVEAPVLLALVAAPLLALDGASLAGKAFADDKYLIAAQAATALLLAGAVTDLLVRVRGTLPTPSTRGPAGGLRPFLVVTGLGLLALAPVDREARFLGVDGLPMFRAGDADCIAGRLAADPEFLPPHRVFQVREPNDRVLRTRLDFRQDWPPREPGVPRRVWTFLKIPAWPLPESLPEGLEVWERDGESRLLALTSAPRLDWEHFEVCEGDAARGAFSCHPSGLAVKPPGDWKGPFVTAPLPTSLGEVPREIRVPLLPGPETALASLPLVARCTATLEVEGLGEARGSPTGRRVVLPALSEALPEARLLVRWTVGRPGCRAPETGVPPLIVEGPPEAVSLLWSLLDQAGLLEGSAGVLEERR